MINSTSTKEVIISPKITIKNINNDNNNPIVAINFNTSSSTAGAVQNDTESQDVEYDEYAPLIVSIGDSKDFIKSQQSTTTKKTTPTTSIAVLGDNRVWTVSITILLY